MGKSATSQPSRLYVKGTILGYKRGRRNTYHHTSLIKIDGVNDTKDSKFYHGKKIAYIYKASKSPTTGTPFRVVWGKVMRSHGSNGVVRCKFKTNLSVSQYYCHLRCFISFSYDIYCVSSSQLSPQPSTMGSTVRVMLYPSTI